MLQGTGSDVGKSVLVAGLGRAYTRRGLCVRPFKPQNMSNNAAIAADGGEIGRAQALQARACRTPPVRDLNPVLLKPQSEVGAQVVVHGQVVGSTTASGYRAMKPTLLPAALESFARVGAGADLVLVEGAGSASEVNLREGDIANMGFAEAADLPVVLIGDIERGGVIASLVGTIRVLPERDRRRIRGYVVNKFRGDPRLFDAGLARIDGETGLRCFGVVPWLEEVRWLPAEDSLGLVGRSTDAERPIKIVVPAFSRIANFDDLDPLALEPDVAIQIVEPGEVLPAGVDLVLLLGSKATRADLHHMRSEGWDVDLLAHVRRGGRVLGLCAGFQMLGRTVRDPEGIEGPPGEEPGLGLLDVETEMGPLKVLSEVSGRDPASGTRVRGYEMHMGATTGPGLRQPFLEIGNRPEGAVSADGRVAGSYVHGLFADDEFRHAFLRTLRERPPSGVVYEARIEAVLDALAAHLERHLDLDALLALARTGFSPDR